MSCAVLSICKTTYSKICLSGGLNVVKVCKAYAFSGMQYKY